MKFLKMHGLGNDFVIFDARNQHMKLNQDSVKYISNRKTGIGCDQIAIINPAKSKDTDCFMLIYNADGGEVGACGNVTRCVASFLMKDLNKDKVLIETIEDILICTKSDNDNITVDMGIPRVKWDEIPLSKEVDTLNLNLSKDNVSNPTAVSVGNPHCVFMVENIDNIDIEKLGSYFENHELFPERTNVEFIKIIDRNTIRMKVWERGTGVTKSCGTGACGSFVAAHRKGLVGDKAKLILDGGELEISINNETGHIFMKGAATYVFKGDIEFL